MTENMKKIYIPLNNYKRTEKLKSVDGLEVDVKRINNIIFFLLRETFTVFCRLYQTDTESTKDNDVQN